MDKDAFAALRKEIVSELDKAKSADDETVLTLIDEQLSAYALKKYINIGDRVKLRKDLFNAIRRLDVLQDLIEDETITEIMVNGADKIFVEKNGRIYPTERCFESEERLSDILQRVASAVNRTVNEAHPIVDARLSDGSRVNIVLPPVSLSGPVVTIRKFRRDIMDMDSLVKLGSVSAEAAEFLQTLVRAGYNLICSGGTGSGKTTLLNVLSNTVSGSERVVTIEDSAELIMNSENLIRLEARNANVEGRNSITIRDLIKTALRMRPDRLIVGEVRGSECIDMLQSLNTGHSGMSTVHANSPEDVVSRLETMVLLGENVPLMAIRAQIASAIDIIIGVSRMRDSSRKVTSIYEVDGIKDGEVVLNSLYEFIEEGNAEAAGSAGYGNKMSGASVQTAGKVCRKPDELSVRGRLVKTGELKHREKLRAAGLSI